jgi:dihydrofolate reductase
MRKLKLQMQLSIDSFVSGVNGEMDWMIWDWDEELKKYVSELTATIDHIILGRKLALGFIPHWAKAAEDKNNPEYPFAKIMHETPKTIFSKSLLKSEWENASLACGNLSEEIMSLKNKQGKDIIVYGGAGFVSSLIKNNLIDEYHLFINPVILGKGLPIFSQVEAKLKLALITSRVFSCGISVLVYKSV